MKIGRDTLVTIPDVPGNRSSGCGVLSDGVLVPDIATQQVAKLDAAIRDGRIEAYYQPVVRLDTCEIVGLEALCRLREPDGEIVSASAFHAALSDESVASRLTDTMLAIVAADARFWLDQGIALQHIGVNISSSDFHGPALGERLRTIFGRHGVPLKHVIIEITETISLNTQDKSVAQGLQALRDLGLLIALDDFGTGYASLSHLLTMPADILKIDKSFIDRLSPNESGLAIVEALIGIAARLDMRVIAEGIESASQAAMLSERGCNLGQGYLFSPPVPRSAATELLVQFAQSPDSDSWIQD